jgi:hypothetical protein
MDNTVLPEVWLRGPVPGILPTLQPVVHALLQAREEVNQVLKGFPEEHLWDKPSGVASVGFHMQHLAGVLDRLFTYAKDMPLSQHQLTALASEGVVQPSVNLHNLVISFNDKVDWAIEQLKMTEESKLVDHRAVGRAGLPSTVIGLLFHAAEHTQRHVGQLLVTARILKNKQVNNL